jgi:ABC-type uncharacterized transport system ATPase subunit
VIEARGLTKRKRFGTITAVDDLTFTVSPGHVTGFVGPTERETQLPNRDAHCRRGAGS